MGGPEFNPRDDEPIDREEYEKAMSNVIVVPGNPEKFRGQVCITSETRAHLGGPAHAWFRAAHHCLHDFKDLNYFQQLEAAKTCYQMGEAFRRGTPRPPQSTVTWGWGKGWPGQR